MRHTSRRLCDDQSITTVAADRAISSEAVTSSKTDQVKGSDQVKDTDQLDDDPNGATPLGEDL